VSVGFHTPTVGENRVIGTAGQERGIVLFGKSCFQDDRGKKSGEGGRPREQKKVPTGAIANQETKWVPSGQANTDGGDGGVYLILQGGEFWGVPSSRVAGGETPFLSKPDTFYQHLKDGVGN